MRQNEKNRHKNRSCKRALKLRLHTAINIGPISYPGECDLMIHQQKYSVMFSGIHFVTLVRT